MTENQVLSTNYDNLQAYVCNSETLVYHSTWFHLIYSSPGSIMYLIGTSV